LTKQELCELVERVYASWNQQVPASTQKDIYNAWWRILKDLEAEPCERAVDLLVIQDSYMPRPGAVYREAIKTIHGWNPPTELEAWEQFRRMADAAHTGNTIDPGQISPEVREVVSTLGGGRTYNLHTNGDRELFLNTYRRHLLNREAELYDQRP